MKEVNREVHGKSSGLRIDLEIEDMHGIISEVR